MRERRLHVAESHVSRQKHGAAPADLATLLDAVDAEPNLALSGLMTMPPHDLDEARRRK